MGGFGGSLFSYLFTFFFANFIFISYTEFSKHCANMDAIIKFTFIVSLGGVKEKDRLIHMIVKVKMTM